MKKLLENTRIMTKVLSVLLMLGFVGIAIAAVNATKMRNIDASYAVLVNHELPATAQLIRTNRYASDIIKIIARAIDFAPASSEFILLEKKLAVASTNSQKALAEAIALDPKLAGQGEAFEARLTEISAASANSLQLYKAGRRDETVQAVRRADALLESLAVELKALNENRIAASEASAERLSQSTSNTVMLALFISILGTAASIGIAYWVVKRGVVTPVNNLEGRMAELATGRHDIEIPCAARGDELGAMGRALVVFRDAAIEQKKLTDAKAVADAEQQTVVETVGNHLASLADGDLTAVIAIEFPESYRALKVNFNAAIGKLNELIGSVAVGAEQIRTGSVEIATASEDLARRTESNAASLEETAAGIGQMDGRLKATAGAAADTVTRADQTMATVASGRSIADEAVQAMSRVRESAKGIDSVIEGLDKIAFQTRVLAMNAAVEAGRAGEAGRGFAVVADLVSALAMRAEEEAKRARDQLTVTQADVVTAVDAVEKVDSALQNISGDVEQVHALLGTIASDNQAQAGAITEINSAIGSMDQATQQNAAMVEETSAAARNLLTEVNALAEQAGRFTTRTERTARPPATAATPPAAAAKSKPARPVRKTNGAAGYQSPVRPLPPEAIGALTRPDEDWREF